MADLIPQSAARDTALVVGAALLTAATAQLVVPLPFTPVPISGQTFAVLLAGAALGPARGAAAMGLYAILGLVGLPFYAEGSSGPAVIMGASGGYIIGFIVAAWVVGLLARRGLDRRVSSTVLAFLAGSLVVYAVGVPWLAIVAGTSLLGAIELGVIPFLIGDVIKAALAGILLPTAWRLMGDYGRE